MDKYRVNTRIYMALLLSSTEKHDPVGMESTQVPTVDLQFNTNDNKILSERTTDDAPGFRDYNVNDIITVTYTYTDDDNEEQTSTFTFTLKDVETGSNQKATHVFTVFEDIPDILEGMKSVKLEHTGLYSDKMKGDGYHGFTDGLHTVSYKIDDFIGDITIQGSLETIPGHNDWFDIHGSTRQYPSLVGVNVQGQTQTAGHNETNGFNFIGNFVWIRVKLFNYEMGHLTMWIKN